MQYLFCYFLLGAWDVGEIKTDIVLAIEEPTDSKAVTSELVSSVNEIETKTDDGEGITDEWTSDLEAVRDNVLDLVVIEELLNE